MEVMAEANEQPALLNQDVDDVKKTQRTKTAGGPRRTTASKTGTRRVKKQTKDEEPIGSETNNHLRLFEGQHDAPAQNAVETPEPAPAQPSAIVEPTTQSNSQKSAEASEPPEESVPAEPVSARFHATPPTVEAPRYDPVFGEG